MAFLMVIPAVAVPSPVTDVPVAAAAAIEDVAPHGLEETQIYWRTMNGRLQFRVWSITNGRWLTDWTNA